MDLIQTRFIITVMVNVVLLSLLTTIFYIKYITTKEHDKLKEMFLDNQLLVRLKIFNTDGICLGVKYINPIYEPLSSYLESNHGFAFIARCDMSDFTENPEFDIEYKYEIELIDERKEVHYTGDGRVSRSAIDPTGMLHLFYVITQEKLKYSMSGKCRRCKSNKIVSKKLLNLYR